MEWINRPGASTLKTDWQPFKLLLSHDGKWRSGNLGIPGSWDTREDGKTGIISAIRRYHESQIRQLDHLEAEAAKERAEVATK